jgi:hypothetical protein
MAVLDCPIYFGTAYPLNNLGGKEGEVIPKRIPTLVWMVGSMGGWKRNAPSVNIAPSLPLLLTNGA